MLKNTLKATLLVFVTMTIFVLCGGCSKFSRPKTVKELQDYFLSIANKTTYSIETTETSSQTSTTLFNRKGNKAYYKSENEINDLYWTNVNGEYCRLRKNPDGQSWYKTEANPQALDYYSLNFLTEAEISMQDDKFVLQGSVFHTKYVSTWNIDFSGNGNFELNGSHEDYQATIKIIMHKPQALPSVPKIADFGFDISFGAIDSEVGDFIRIKTIPDTDVEWNYSDKSLVQLNVWGNRYNEFDVMKDGTLVLSVTSLSNPKKKSSITFSFKKPTLKISMPFSDRTEFEIGEEINFTAKKENRDVSNVRWSLSNTSIGRIENPGSWSATVATRAVGVLTVTATNIYDSSISDSITITIVNATLTLKTSENRTTFEIGETVGISAQSRSHNDKNWIIDPSIKVSFTSPRKSISFLAEKVGTYTFTATDILDPTATDTIIITIVPMESFKLAIGEDNKLIYEVGERLYITAYSNFNQLIFSQVTLTFDKPEMIQQTSSGAGVSYRIVKAGFLTMTATCSGISYNVTFEFKPMKNITINILYAGPEFKVGDDIRLEVYNNNGYRFDLADEIKLFVDNPDILFDYGNGSFKAYKSGTVTVYATSKIDPTVSTSITIVIR